MSSTARPNRTLTLAQAWFFALVVSACNHSSLDLPASSNTAASGHPINQCANNSGGCTWYKQGQTYTDCVDNSGHGFGCNWRCESYWCSSSDSHDRANTAPTNVSTTSICTVTSGGGAICATGSATSTSSPAATPTPAK